MRSLATFAAILFPVSLMLGAADTEMLHMKVVAVGATDGATVSNLSLTEWKTRVAGKEIAPVSQRGPMEISNAPHSWVLVFLPMESPSVRKLALSSALGFMKGLPAGDRVMVVVRNAKGLECLTPGFTTRPTLWSQALRTLETELPAELLGNSDAAFVIPAQASSEAVEGRESLTEVEKEFSSLELKRQPKDGVHHFVFERYPASSLAGYTEAVKKVFRSLETLGGALAQVPGEKQVIIWSRCAVDHLADPQWDGLTEQPNWGPSGQTPARSVEKIQDDSLQIHLMRKEVKEAQEHLKAAFTRMGLTLHSVGGADGEYSGAFADAAITSGGQNFRFDASLPAKLNAVLSSWAARYELLIPVPAGQERPQKVEISTQRPGVRIIAPKLQ